MSQGGYLNRSFTYDGLSHLSSASNPESGTTSYTYDSNGNAISRTRPAPNQTNPAVTVTTTYSYDDLNRLTAKNYSDGVTPYAGYAYDTSTWWNNNPANAIGRLTGEGTYSSAQGFVSSALSYDPMGRLATREVCLPSICTSVPNPQYTTLSYGYDLIGEMIGATNGEGVTLSYYHNLAQRVTAISSSLDDSNHPVNPLLGAHYNATGALTSATLDNTAVSETRVYDGRMRLSSITDSTGSTSLYAFSAAYNSNSTIYSANDSINGNWIYSYDPFNRLGSASATGQSYTYAYDRFGNRWQQSGTHPMNESFSGNNNRMDGYSYDAAGNLLSDGTTSYTYDAENRIISATNGNGTTTYIYDAEGRRVRKTVGGVITDYLYDVNANEVAAVNGAGNWLRGEVYAAGRHIATYSGGRCVGHNLLQSCRSTGHRACPSECGRNSG